MSACTLPPGCGSKWINGSVPATSGPLESKEILKCPLSFNVSPAESKSLCNTATGLKSKTSLKFIFVPLPFV